MVFGRGMRREATSSGRSTARTSLVRGLAAVALCMSGAVITGLATTATPAGAANPTPLIYEIDNTANAINIFPASASGNVAPSVSLTANANSLKDPLGGVFDAAGDLWVANEAGDTIAEYTPSQLASSGNPLPAVILSDSNGPTGLTFDTHGNLWATTVVGGVEKFTPGQLTSSGAPTPAVTISRTTAGSLGLAFDAAGDLWVATFDVDNTLVEYTPAQQASSGTPTPAVTLSALPAPRNPTFDANGDLWFSTTTVATISELTPTQLASSGSPTPAVRMTGSAIGDPAGLALDTAGNLWAADQGSVATPPGTNGVYEYNPNQLAAGGPQSPAVSITGSNTTFASPNGVLISEPPVVGSISPAAGSGGTTVTIHGAGFNYGSTVHFGAVAASSVTQVSPYELQAVVPSGSGTVDVTVSTFAGTSATSAADQFTYPAPPTPTPSHGYWLVGSDGGIFSFGQAQFYGSTGSLHLQRPVVGMVPTSDHGGYWLDASDGGVFSYGDTQFYGSIPGLGLHPAGSGLPNSLNAPVAGMVPSADGGGYFMVASDGGVFAFGDAHFAGSCPGIGGCAGAAVAVMPDASGNGYWLVTQSGNVYTFGDASYYGAPGNTGSPVTSAVRTPDGGGYWILTANGAVHGYGDAGNFGDAAGSFGLNPATAIFTTSDGGGYWIAASNGAVNPYGDAPNEGGLSGTHLNGSIIAGTGF